MLSFVPVANDIIQLNHQLKYYISVEKPMDSVNLNSCVDKRVEIAKFLENGILTIGPDCAISTDDIRIRSHNHKYFNDTKIIIPSNSIENLTIDKIDGKNYVTQVIGKAVSILDYESDFDILAEQADELIKKENNKMEFERIHYDNMTHSYTIYVIIATMGILSAVMGFIIHIYIQR